jgi:hypothetical protein
VQTVSFFVFGFAAIASLLAVAIGLVFALSARHASGFDRDVIFCLSPYWLACLLFGSLGLGLCGWHVVRFVLEAWW